MSYWRTTASDGKPKYWDKPNCRWKLNPAEDEGLIEFSTSQADYDELKEDSDTTELTLAEAMELSEDWGDPPWTYPTAEELNGIGYCSVADMRDGGIGEDKATEDELKKALATARHVINSFCGRDFWRQEKTYHLDGEGTNVLFLTDRPIIRVSFLKADDTEIQENEYKVYSEAGYIKLTDLMPIPSRRIGGVFPKGAQNIEVQGEFGFSPIPPEVRRACYLISIAVLTELKTEISLTESAANSTRNAVGLKKAKIEDISVEFEYPRNLTSQKEWRTTTGNAEADSLLLKFKKDVEAMAI